MILGISSGPPPFEAQGKQKAVPTLNHPLLDACARLLIANLGFFFDQSFAMGEFVGGDYLVAQLAG